MHNTRISPPARRGSDPSFSTAEKCGGPRLACAQIDHVTCHVRLDEGAAAAAKRSGHRAAAGGRRGEARAEHGQRLSSRRQSQLGSAQVRFLPGFTSRHERRPVTIMFCRWFCWKIGAKLLRETLSSSYLLRTCYALTISEKRLFANRITFQATPTWKWELKLNTELLDFNKNATNNTIITARFKNPTQHSFSSYTKIYTDASTSEHGVSFAVIKYEIIIQHKLPVITSIFSAMSSMKG